MVISRDLVWRVISMVTYQSLCGRSLATEMLVMPVAIPIQLTYAERQTLIRWARGRRTPARVVLRAKIVLHAAEGLINTGIAAALIMWAKT